jgi:hypothetical protein
MEDDKSFAPQAKFAEITRMIRSLPVLLCAIQFIVCVLAQAQALDPILAPQAEKYTLSLDELRRTRKATITRYETEYAQKLDSVIAAAKDEATITKLRKEREGVVKGMLAPGNPVGLPEEAVAARKLFLNGAGKASLEFHAAKKKLDDAYLKTLAGLAKQARGKNAPQGLAAQVAAEKRRVTTGN